MAAIEIKGTSPKGVKAYNKAILKIIKSKNADEATKQKALEVLESGVRQGNHTITNSVFKGKF